MSCGSGRGRAPGATARAEIHATTRDSSLFRRGPPAEVRLVVLVVLAVALIIMDSQLRVLEPVRRAVSVAIYPSSAPSWRRVIWSSRSMNGSTRPTSSAAKMKPAAPAHRAGPGGVSRRAVGAENAQLRRLLGVTDTVAQSAVVVEVLYEPTSAFNQRLVFNKGSKAGLAPGMPVIDEGGVVGQIVRVTR